MWRERGRVQNAGRNKDDCFIGQFVFMCMDRLENRAGECATLLLGGMAAVLLHLFAQEESVFYLMTGMSVVSHYYFTVWITQNVSDMEMVFICETV